MARRVGEGRGGPGGIIALANIVEDHAGALDYDLMTLTRWTLDDLGDALGWVTLLHFVQNLPPTSALVRSMNPDLAEQLAWANGQRNAALLADIYDVICVLRYEMLSALPHRGAVMKPSPHTRPGIEDNNKRTIGSGAVSIAEFEWWWSDGG